MEWPKGRNSAQADLALERLNPADPQTGGLVVVSGFGKGVAIELLLFRHSPLAVAMMRLVVDNDYVFEGEKLAAGTLKHLSIGFPGFDRRGIVSLEKRAADPR